MYVNNLGLMTKMAAMLIYGPQREKLYLRKKFENKKKNVTLSL